MHFVAKRACSALGTRKYATGICMWSFVLPINPSGPFFFIVWWGKEKLKLKEILIIVKLPPKSWKKEFCRILCRHVRGLALSKNNFSCISGLCYTSLLGSQAFLILNTVYFKHTQQASDKCALALLLNEVLKISLERDILVQGPNWEPCASYSHPKRTQVNPPHHPSRYKIKAREPLIMDLWKVIIWGISSCTIRNMIW